MTMNIEHTLLAAAFFFGGCTVALIAQQLLPAWRWAKIRRRTDALIKMRLQQQLKQHEAECPMVQICAQHDGTSLLPTGKKQSYKMILSFMMTHYPGFMKELEEHLHTRLSIAEQQTCFLVKLGFRNRQIGESTGVSPNSVIKTKQRLRQKLNGAPEGEELTQWIQQLGEPTGKMPPGYVVFREED